MEIRFNAEIEELDTKLWGTGLRVPVSTVRQLRELGWKRLHCTFGGKVEKATSLTAFQQAHFLILNQAILKKTGRTPGESMEVVLRQETSEFGSPMPEAFKSALELDPTARTYFEALSPGNKRNLIYIVQKVKSTELQIKKALIINEHLKESEGKLDFKQLHTMLKGA